MGPGAAHPGRGRPGRRHGHRKTAPASTGPPTAWAAPDHVAARRRMLGRGEPGSSARLGLAGAAAASAEPGARRSWTTATDRARIGLIREPGRADADPPGTGGGAAGPDRPVQPGHRRTAVSVGAHRGQPSGQDLQQARDYRPAGTGWGPGHSLPRSRSQRRTDAGRPADGRSAGKDRPVWLFRDPRCGTGGPALSPPGSDVHGTTRNGAVAGGLLDASAKRGPSTSGVRISSVPGGRLPWASAVMTTEPVDIDQATVTGVFGRKPGR